MTKISTAIGLTMAMAICTAVPSHGAEWSQWEHDNSMAVEGDWMVIRQPPHGDCYLKQSYQNASKMELLIKQGGRVVLITPFLKLKGGVYFQVDTNQQETMPALAIEHHNSIELPVRFFGEMKAGHELQVVVEPVGAAVQTQFFSLRGLTGASRWLDAKGCQFSTSEEATGKAGETMLDVQLEQVGNGKIQVVGKTNLPSGMHLMIGLRNPSTNYSAQDKVVVSNGTFTSATFSNRGSALPTGSYRVSISSPLPRLQPAEVKSAIGKRGELLSGVAVVEEDGKKRIDWTVQRHFQ